MSIRIRLINRCLLAGLLIGLAGCNKSPASSLLPSGGTSGSSSDSSGAEPAPNPDAAAVTSPTPLVQSTTISAEGMGTARLGMTLGGLKQAMPAAEFAVKSPFMVDFDAIAVTQNGVTQFHILYLASSTFTDEDTIQGLLTDNPGFQTAQGVGPGSLIEQAEQVYGQATLSFNTQNESREYVRFQRQPAPSISFATGNGSQQTAGIYPSPAGAFNETQQYQADAKIQSILLVCLTDSCVPATSTPSPPS